MHSLGFPISLAVIIALLGGLALLALRFLNHNWWQSKLIRLLLLLLPGFGFLGDLMFVAGVSINQPLLQNGGLLLVGIVMVMELMMLVTLPLASLVRRLGRLIAGRFPGGESANEARPVDLSRRIFVSRVAGAIPLAALGLGAGGFSRAFASVRVYPQRLVLDNLPPDLVGLKILHLSDLHLGPWVSLGDIEKLLAEAATFEPDMVLITGDIADQLTLLPEVLRLVDQLPAELGKYACLGNHEHYRGLATVRRAFDASPIPLLVDEGLALTRGERSIWLGGIDDPRRMSGNHDRFYRTALEGAFSESGSDDFLLLMSHRPSILDIAAENSVNLTLAGHTHGAQVGFMGRSMFDNFANESYLWGHYFIGESHLYTSSGVGHWFPFRLGCPPEAPIITLA